MTGAPRSLPQLLVLHRDELLRHVNRAGSGLLAYESAQDVVQGIHQRALERAPDFVDHGDAAFAAFVARIAEAYIADRHAYWSALKRNRARLLRLTGSHAASHDPRAAPTPAASTIGPGTRAELREQMALAVAVLGTLPPRDRKLVLWMTQDVPLAEQAARLGVSHAAAQRAGLRAVERFQKTFRLVVMRAR